MNTQLAKSEIRNLNVCSNEPRIKTYYDERMVERLSMNYNSVHSLAIACELNNVKLDINNGTITSATEHHRTYVNINDDRNPIYDFLFCNLLFD